MGGSSEVPVTFAIRSYYSTDEGVHSKPLRWLRVWFADGLGCDEAIRGGKASGKDGDVTRSQSSTDVELATRRGGRRDKLFVLVA